MIGVEADIQGTGERGRSVNPLGTFSVPVGDNTLSAAFSTTNEASFPWFATFRGRAGFLADPSLLLYATGGLAVGEVKFSSQGSATATLTSPAGVVLAGPLTVLSTPISESQTRLGWTVGAGLEKKFNRNWSVKLEYIYLDFGSRTYFGGTPEQTGVAFRDHIARAGINYQFTSGPVVAKN